MDRAETELQRTQALLTQARADRDRLQVEVLRLTEQLRWLKRIPGASATARLRARLPRRTHTSPPPAFPAAPTRPEHPRPGRYLDVTNLRNPARTGIARVTIRLGAGLDYSLVAQRDGSVMHDTTFVPEIFGREPDAQERQRHGTPLVPGPGVVLLDPAIQLDDGFSVWQRYISRLREAGGNYIQIVHDLLPLTLPDFFDYGMRQRFPAWLSFVVQSANLILTDSAATAADLTDWARAKGASGTPAVSPWPLGCDPLPPPERRTRDGVASGGGPRVLTVGTVEPRKAVDVVLDAVVHLRSRGVPAELVLVGAAGWADPTLTEHLAEAATAPWFTWLVDADDQRLADEYAAADVLVAASRGEGFGLPIVEAQAAGVSVVARDLPVFRELLAEDAVFFDLDSNLADAILTAWRSAPSAPARTPTSWQAAADEVDRLITATVGIA